MPTPDWSRITNTTIHEYVRKEEVNILRNRKLLAKMKALGRITFGHSGDYRDWKVRYKRAAMQGYADSDTLTFARKDRWKTAQLDWRGYAATDSMTKLERLKNKDTSAIIKIFSQVGASLMDDINDQFGDELYIDGAASGNTKRLHGLESIFASTTASSSGAAPIGTNGATYAGLVTTLGNYGGSWTGTWPTGTGDAHYDFWTPLVVDYTSAIASASGGWQSTTKTWPNTGKEALRFGIIKGKKNKSKDGQLDLIILNDELYRQFLNGLDAAERLVVQRGDDQGLYKLGFTDVVNFDGVDITSEYGIPSSLGYGMATSQMELCSLQDQLFVTEGPDYNMADQSYRLSIDFFGNLNLNPRNMTKWVNLGGT